MRDILLFWAGKGVDGFRCDMVELVPWEFFRCAIREVKAQYPDLLFVAEVYQKENYDEWVRWAGFDTLYDKSGLYDILRSLVGSQREGRRPAPECSAAAITRNWQSLGPLQPRMLNFLENHDEQRFASPFFGGEAARAFAPLAVSLLFNTAPFLLYFGEEIGERAAEAADGRTSIFNAVKIPSLQRLCHYARTQDGLLPEEERILARFRELLRRCDEPAFAEGATFDLGYCNLSSPGFDPALHFAFLRSGAGKTFLIFCNFSPAPAQAEILIPEHASAMLGIPAGRVSVSAGASDATILAYP